MIAIRNSSLNLDHNSEPIGVKLACRYTLMDTSKHTGVDIEMEEVVVRNGTRIRIWPAKDADLESINNVITHAILTWDLPARVKRLMQPIYRYDEHDIRHLTMLVAENASGDIVGVANWEPANSRDTPWE